MKTVVTVTGIRPDFIRMRNVFREFDKRFNHIMIHTGQHYHDELSQIFFKELGIRKPDYTLTTGRNSTTPYEQLSYLSTAIIELFNKQNINPDVCVFLGDSHSVLASIPLFKAKYKIAHIEGGMRSYDRRMPEEVNRVCCDYVSDYVFVYTPLYKQRLIAESKNPKSIFVVGNTITEIVKEYMPSGKKSREYILADIHRNENLDNDKQYEHILKYLSLVSEKIKLPVKLVKFNRAELLATARGLYEKYPNVELVGPFGFIDFLNLQYNALGLISDSGTAQEEGPLLMIPVAVPRNYTERPESLDSGCSILVGETDSVENMTKKTLEYFKNYNFQNINIKWLGSGKTSVKIADILQQRLYK